MDISEVICYSFLFSSILNIVRTENDISDFVETIIEKNHLRKEGYTDFRVTELHLIGRHSKNNERLSSDVLQRLKRSNEYDGAPVELNFAAFNKSFDISLRYNHVIANPDLPVIIRTANSERVKRMRIEDCYMIGETSRGGVVALSYCNGIEGSVEEGDYLYRIDPLGPIQEDGNEEVLVSKIPVEQSLADLINVNGISTGTEQGDSNERIRRKREIPSTTFMIELGIFVDEIFFAMLKNDYHAETEQQKVDIMARKYNVVQSLFDLMKNDLGYTVTLKIRSMDFWEENPGWFVFNETVLKDNLNSFCNGIVGRTDVLPVDHFHLHVGANDANGVDGYAKIPGLCTGTKCGVSADTNFNRGHITAHELGHTLTMLHDTDTACSGDTGIMDPFGKGEVKWTSCNLEQMEAFLDTPGAACLFEVNVSSSDVSDIINAVALTGETPGMLLSDSDMCEMTEGAGWESLYWDIVEDVCTHVTCVNMTSGAYYSTMTSVTFRLPDAYCGDGKGCKGSKCLTYEELRIDTETLEIIQGGWSEWGPVSTCSKQCGNGMTVKKRTCTNPKPKNAAPCEGPKYLGEICSTEPCEGDSEIVLELRKARASEVCTAFVENKVLSSTEYDGTGDRYSFSGDKQCQVKCTPQSGFTPPSSTKYGFMPNGVVCSFTNWMPELYGLPRATGFKGLCINGRCQKFGCDNTNSGVLMDYCGVCGGTNSTCTLVDGVYTLDVPTGERATFETLSAGTKMIQFYFKFSDMRKWYVEVWNAAGDVPLIQTPTVTNTDLQGTVTAAGAEWHYVSNKQYLVTWDTLSEDVQIKIYNKDANPNTGIYYGYSIPLDVTTSTPGVTDSVTDGVTNDVTNGVTGGVTNDVTDGVTDGVTGGVTNGVTGNVSDGVTNGGTTGYEDNVCKWGMIKCRNDRCIEFFNLCDGVDDCGDNSDENVVCGAEALVQSTVLIALIVLALLKIFM